MATKPAAATPFMSVENLKVCIDVFRSYMIEKYEFDPVASDADGHRQTMYTMMTETSRKHPPSEGLTRKQMNNFFLNATRDHYVRAYNLGGGTRKVAAAAAGAGTNNTATTMNNGTASRLANDIALFEGQRKPVTPMARGGPGTVPLGVPHGVAAGFKALEGERRRETDERAQMASQRPSEAPFKETAFDPQEFERKLTALRDTRDLSGEQKKLDAKPTGKLSIAVGFNPLPSSVPHATLADADADADATNRRLEEDLAIQRERGGTDVPPSMKELFTAKTAPPQEEEDPEQNEAVVDIGDNNNKNGSRTERKAFVAPPAAASYVAEKYLIVNGFDRDWSLHAHRFSVVADFGAMSEHDLQAKYRNIRSLSMKRAIIPQEIGDAPTLTNPAKTVYNYPFSFSVPYVLITIDEIPSVFDGTNDVVRRSFCQMIVDKHYRAPNGRGFFVLQTMQEERKVFYPTPMSSLTRLSIAVRKPNGELYNASKDDYKITKIQRDDLNPLYLLVVVDKFFDKNEFFKGDTVKLRRFTIVEAAAASSSAGARRMADFVNREAGHAVAEMGQPNTSGYYRTFYIRGPGNFDAQKGVNVPDAEAFAALDASDAEAVDAVDAVDAGATNGEVMNTTLQCVFSLKVETVIADFAAEYANTGSVTA